MHAHSIQPNPYAAIDALRSAQKTAARREAAIVRKELEESASELAGDSEIGDACVLSIGEHKQSRKPPNRRNQNGPSRGQQETSTNTEETDPHLSD
jgi:hypothetical protein